MADDGKIKIDTEINTSGGIKGLKKLQDTINKIPNCTKSAVRTLGDLGNTINGFDAIQGKISAAFTKVREAVNETVELYKKQASAEKQLEVAAKNNPYLDSSSVSKLKSYASELQSIGTVGDEQLLPLMAELAAAGRTQSEIQDIMSAALDASASGAISLDSAVQSLNRSYSGEVGMLGRILPDVKDLTEEDLKNGKAVDAVKKAYKGMAQEVGDATGSAERLNNAIGDFKEKVGASFNKALSPMENWFTKFFTNINNAIDKQNEFNKASGNLKNYNAETANLSDQEQHAVDLQRVIDGLGDQREELKKEKTAEEAVLKTYKTMAEYSSDVSDTELELQEQRVKELEDKITSIGKDILQYRNELVTTTSQINKGKSAQQKTEEQNKLDAAKKQRDTDATNLIKSNTDALNQNIKQIEAKYAVQEAEGQTVDELAKQQEILNAQEQAYVDLITTDTSLVTQNNPVAKERLKTIQEQAQAVGELASTMSSTDAEGFEGFDSIYGKMSSEELNQALQNLSDASVDSVSETLKNENEYVDQLYQDGVISYEQYTAAKEKLDDEWKEHSQETTESVMNTVSSVVGNMVSTMSTLSEMVTTNAENEASIQTAELEKQYAAGEISEEEYYAQKEKIEKEAAEKAYKIQMWEWAASLLQIGVNTAQGITSALATKPATLGLVLAGSIGVLGAAQLAAAIANKPVPPSYATGGIVGGTSYSGDRVQANVNSGEMILNGKQQLALWKAANSNGSGGGMAVQVKNYMGGQANVAPQITSEGLQLIIRQTVANDLENRRLNSSLLQAENTFNGINYQS